MNLSDPITDEIRDIFRCNYGFRSARDRLVLSAENIITYEANRLFKICFMAKEDLAAEFRLYLLIHAHQMKWTPGYRFAFFAKRCVRQRAWDLLRYRRRMMRSLLEQSQYLLIEEYEDLLTDDVIADSLEILHEAVFSLPPKYRDPFLKRYNINTYEIVPFKIAAKNHGVSVKQLHYLIDSANNLIKDYIYRKYGDFSFPLRIAKFGVQPYKETIR